MRWQFGLRREPNPNAHFHSVLIRSGFFCNLDLVLITSGL